MILVVEDDERVGSAIACLLEMQGHVVRLVPSADQALQALSTETVELIISDLLLGGRTGAELLNVARTLPRCREVRALLVTGSGRELAERHLQKAGVPLVPILNKPFSPEELLDAVAAAVPLVSTGKAALTQSNW
jgi:two-component system, response regulator FlrC